jgi:hypothetical protein
MTHRPGRRLWLAAEWSSHPANGAGEQWQIGPLDRCVDGLKQGRRAVYPSAAALARGLALPGNRLYLAVGRYGP